jgi:hypothetical protein
MMKKMLWGLAVSLFLAQAVQAEERYSISGVATFKEGAVIFISLYTFERFQQFRNNPLPSEPFTLIIEPSLQEKQAGKVPFKFEGIPEGDYAVIAFRDRKKPDAATLARKPASRYRMMTFSGRWEDVKFSLNRNITGLDIRFEGTPQHRLGPQPNAVPARPGGSL